MPIHTSNFEAIKALIIQAPVLHLPAWSGRFYLECDSNAKHLGSVLYQIQNGTRHVIAFYSMWFEKITTAFPISVEIFHIHCAYGPQCLKMHLLLSQACENYVYRTSWRKFQIFHLIFSISWAKLQKIVIPSLFKTDRASKWLSAKASILQDPPAVMARKRLAALPPLDVSQSAPGKRRHGRPPIKKAIVPISPIPELNEVMAKTLMRHYQCYTLLDAAENNLQQKHQRYWHRLSRHLITMMKQLWSKYANLIYKITWTSHRELH